MMEKDNVSMTTVQLKPEYAASEMYSTTSEPPPAYKRQANSVKIAKITAFTVILSSIIIGSFILASAYLQAKASCDQVQALDSVLEKELMLETLQQVNKELPRAEALLGKENDDMDLQNIDKEDRIKKEEQTNQEGSKTDEETTSNDTDSSFSDSEETDDLRKVQNKVPLELDLSDLAAALLQNNQKSRMNCVVERKRAEEILDSPARTVALPFGLNLTTDPKKARITGERISIFCDGGDDKEQKNNEDTEDDDAEPIRPMFIPFQRVPIPFGATPQQFPLTHMPQRMMPERMMQQQQPMYRQLPPPFQHLPMRPPMPPQVMQAPHQEPQQVRIQVQQIPIREFHVAQDVPVQIASSSGSDEMPHYQVQRVPLGVALERAGITSDDLRNIQRMAEERITEELRRLAAEEAAASSASSSSSSSETENGSDEDESASTSSSSSADQQIAYGQQQLPLEHQAQERIQQLMMQQQPPPMPKDTMTPPMPDQPQLLQIGRGAYGRSLLRPVNIPVPMMQPRIDMSEEATADSERPHFVQPRSIRSVDNVFNQEHKRVKKCACDCNC